MGLKVTRAHKGPAFIGVTRPLRSKKWRACIYINGKSVCLGYHDSEVDAAKAYDRKAAPLGRAVNFPGEKEEKDSLVNKNAHVKELLAKESGSMFQK